MLVSCTSRRGAAGNNDQKKTDWSVKLEEDKKPYGIWMTNQLFKSYFPSAKGEALNKNFRYTSIDEQMRYHPDSPALMVIVGLDFYLAKDEWSSLVQFIRAGNEIMIFAARLDEGMQKSLHCTKVGYGEEQPLNIFNDGSSNINAVSLAKDTSKRYGYNGRYIGGYFKTAHSFKEKFIRPQSSADEDESEAGSADSSSSGTDDDEPLVIRDFDSIPEVLGYSREGPDFIRYRIGRGHLTLHAAPLVLSNYFLLQQANKPYFDGIWHTLPDNISVVYSNPVEKRKPQKSQLSALLNNPATRRAFWIILSVLVLYVLFNLKRRQRIIPVIRPLGNESVSFVETIGRLYYNKGVHSNLAEKMVQHFLEWVRANYYINTNDINETFAQSLAAKSGKPPGEVSSLLNQIHHVRLGNPLTATELTVLYQTIQSFVA